MGGVLRRNTRLRCAPRGEARRQSRQPGGGQPLHDAQGRKCPPTRRCWVVPAIASGRLIFRNVHGEISWTTHLDWPDVTLEKVSTVEPEATYDWFTALTNHTVLRRAADDAHLALSNPPPRPSSSYIEVSSGSSSALG